jgi:ribosomal protein S12
MSTKEKGLVLEYLLLNLKKPNSAPTKIKLKLNLKGKQFGLSSNPRTNNIIYKNFQSVLVRERSCTGIYQVLKYKLIRGVW